MKEKLCVLTLILLIIYSISFTTTVEGSDVQEVAKGFENSRDFKKSLGSSIDSETDSYPFYRLVPLSVIQIYQRFISPIKATSCPMYPSCSHYAEEAFKRYNPLKAFVMTADRLHRCTHDLDNYKKVEVSGFVKFFDPVEPSLNTTPLTMPTSLSVKESTTITLASSILDTSADTHSEDGRLFHFAQMLESEGDYQMALIEYRRLIFYFPNSLYLKQAMKSILHCYYKTAQYLLAIHWGQELLNTVDLLEEENEINFFMGLSYLKVGNYRLARKHFNEVIAIDESNFKEKGILLKGLSFAKEENWEEAERTFAQIKIDSRFFNNAKQSIELSKQGKRLRKKSPVIAGLLGIVPGLGYLYSGYEQTALASFIVNGLFILGTVEAFKQGNEGLGIMLGIISSGFYSGNIYGSVQSAQRSNVKSKNDLLLKFDLGFEF